MSIYTEDLCLKFSNDGTSATTSNQFEYHLGSLESKRYIVIPADFYTDGNTLPKFAEFLRIFVPRWSYVKATLVHDALCKHYHVCDVTEDDAPYCSVIEQKEVDFIFKEALLVLGAGPILANIRYGAVRIYQIIKSAMKTFRNLLKDEASATQISNF